MAPSLVSDRYVQFTPAYTGGPAMAEGTVLPRERTATPLEVDDLYASLNRVSTTLGPNGANKNGALSDLLDTLAAQRQGQRQGAQRHDHPARPAGRDAVGQRRGPVRHRRQPAEVHLRARRERRPGQPVQRAGRRRQPLPRRRARRPGRRRAPARHRARRGAEVHQRQPRAQLKSNVDKLASVTKVLVDQRAALSEVLDIAPVALSNISTATTAPRARSTPARTSTSWPSRRS